MNILPAIDLQDGRCVRLTQGDFARATHYDVDPLRIADQFTKAGATGLHIVDLDGARSGAARQFDLIASIAQNTPLKIQVGGGIRDADTIRRYLDAGVQRIVIGSLAVREKEFVRDWLTEFGGDTIVLAFDIRENDGSPEILTQGWQQNSHETLWDVLTIYQGSGLKNILCTDVERDGMLGGANVGLYRDIQSRFPQLNVIASGGIGSLQDLTALSDTAVEAIIVGKALYEGKINLIEAIECVKYSARSSSRPAMHAQRGPVPSRTFK